MLENDVGKGEIARDKQFHLFLQCFQRMCDGDNKKPGLVWERVNPVTFCHVVSEGLLCHHYIVFPDIKQGPT